MAPRSGIDGHSKESQNTSNSRNQGARNQGSHSQGSHSQGAWAQALVKKYLVSRGFYLVAENQQICGVEVDLILSHPRKEMDWILEVKSTSSLDYVERRITETQKNRLRRVVNLSCERQRPSQLVFAFVSKTKILIIEDSGSFSFQVLWSEKPKPRAPILRCSR